MAVRKESSIRTFPVLSMIYLNKSVPKLWFIFDPDFWLTQWQLVLGSSLDQDTAWGEFMKVNK